MPQSGCTETFDASEVDAPTIWSKVEELSKVKKGFGAFLELLEQVVFL